MSVDFDLYLTNPVHVAVPASMPIAKFCAEDPARLANEDISDRIRRVVGRRRWLVRLHVSGAPTEGEFAAFDHWILDLVTRENAVLIDLQTDRFVSAKAEGALAPEEGNTDPVAGELSVYFEDVEAFHALGMERVLDAIENVLPEAFPRRFGEFEPLQGTLAPGKTKDFLKAFAASPDQFLKARTPFSHIYISLPCKTVLAGYHPDHRIFKHVLKGRLSIEIRAKGMSDPRLPALLAALGDVTGAFYGDVREGASDIPAWFWTGIPAGPVKALLLGPPYTDLWPKVANAGVPLTGGRVLLRTSRANTPPPLPPAHLADPGARRESGKISRSDYATTFPFEIPSP